MTTTTALDLTPFCSTGMSRYAIHEPWRKGDTVYATDGAILIAVDASLCPDVEIPGINKLVPLVDEILQGISEVKRWRKLPELATDCDKCDGTGRLTVPCDKCAGSGVCTCQCGDEHECSICEGDGIVDGGICIPCIVRIGSRQVQLGFARKIAALPYARVAIDPSCEHRICFRFDGGHGVLMCVADG